MLASYPWYIADWLSSRRRAVMTLEERGLYRDVLDLCYQHGSVPANERVLRRMVGCDEEEFGRAWPAVRQCLVEGNDGELTHPRVQEILPTLFEMKRQREEKARKGAAARWQPKADRMLERSRTQNAPMDATSNASSSAPGNASSNARRCSTLPSPLLNTETRDGVAGELAMLEQCSEHPPSKNWKTEKFGAFWALVWLRVGKADAERAFRKVATDVVTADLIIAAAQRQGPRLLADAHSQTRSPIHPATWLRAGRYLDEVPEPSAQGEDPGDLPEHVPAWMQEPTQ